MPSAPKALAISARTPFAGPNQWRFKKEGARDPYQAEHDALFAAIREDKPINDAERGAKSTMTAILGRLATYSGKMVEWNEALNSNINLMPDKLALDAEPKVLPDPATGLYKLPVPGHTVCRLTESVSLTTMADPE